MSENNKEEQIKNKILDIIKDKNIDQVYVYLAMFFESMEKEEKLMWINILDIIEDGQ